MQHLDEGTIHAWLDGALPPDEAAAAAAHAAACAACAAAVAEARGLIAGAARIVSSLDSARGGAVPAANASIRRGTAPRSLWQRLHLSPSRAAIAATLLVAAASVLTVRHQPPPAGTMIDSPVRPRMTDVPASVTGPAPKPAPLQTITSAAAPAAPAAAQSRAAGAAVGGATAPRDSAATTNVAAAAPAAGAAGGTNSFDATAKAADASRGAAGFAPAVANVERLTQLSITTLESELEGCYQLSSPAGDAAMRGGLPQRFVLARSTTAHTALPRNVVRRVTPSGGADSVIAGSEWLARSPNRVQVVLGDSAARRTIELELTGMRVANEAAKSATLQTVAPVRAVRCHP